MRKKLDYCHLYLLDQSCSFSNSSATAGIPDRAPNHFLIDSLLGVALHVLEGEFASTSRFMTAMRERRHYDGVT